MKNSCDRHSISGLVVCQNSSKTLRRCLASLEFCDELIVVDGGSTDDTQAIAREYTQNIYERPYLGANDQKEFARSKANGYWVLNVDSDEWISYELAKEILTAIDRETAQGYRIPVRTLCGGYWLRTCGYWPGYQRRLFLRDHGYWDRDVEPHDRVKLDGTWKRLGNPIEHETADSFDELETKAKHYGKVAGKHAVRRGYKIDPISASLRPIWRFLRSYILRGGFTDNRAGLRLARIQYLEGREKYDTWRKLQRGD